MFLDIGVVFMLPCDYAFDCACVRWKASNRLVCLYSTGITHRGGDDTSQLIAVQKHVTQAARPRFRELGDGAE